MLNTNGRWQPNLHSILDHEGLEVLATKTHTAFIYIKRGQLMWEASAWSVGSWGRSFYMVGKGPAASVEDARLAAEAAIIANKPC